MTSCGFRLAAGWHVPHRLVIEEDDVPEQLKVVIYRILQESMNNVAKHSEADRVLIGLVKNGKELKLTVEANGRGLDLEKVGSSADPMSGHGLSSRFVKRLSRYRA